MPNTLRFRLPALLRVQAPAWVLAGALIAVPLTSRAVEEPAYQVTGRLDEQVELRQYAPFVVAEVEVQGPAADAGSLAFPILADYIFGKNKGARKLALTAPVAQVAVPQKLAMTAPVTQSAAPGGAWRVQFVLPSELSLDSAPEPIDARVTLHEVPAHRVAVIRYSGFWSQSNYDEHLAALEAALRKAGLAWVGDPVYARYNPPFMPWFLRRNEIWLGLP